MVHGVGGGQSNLAIKAKEHQASSKLPGTLAQNLVVFGGR